ncbi:MAG: hypothetical protein KF819_38125 [Labilithrix sp.]|nr:hypothetical protein [Labilithrix sp.]
MATEAADSEEPKVSATVILDQIQLMKGLFGEDTLVEARASLPPPLRTELEELLAGRWCSLDAARELKIAVARLQGEDPLAFQRRIVRLGIEKTLTTLWRFFMRQLGDESIARRTPVLYARSFNKGSLEFVSWGKGEAELALHGWPRIPEFDLVGLMAGIETVLALAGRKHPQVRAARRGPIVQLRATWTR